MRSFQAIEQFHLGLNPAFPVDALEMVFHRVVRDLKLKADLLVDFSGHDPPDDFLLPSGYAYLRQFSWENSTATDTGIRVTPITVPNASYTTTSRAYSFYNGQTGAFCTGQYSTNFGGSISGIINTINETYTRTRFYVRVLTYAPDDVDQTGTPVSTVDLPCITVFDEAGIKSSVEAELNAINLCDYFTAIGEQAMLLSDIWLMLRSHEVADEEHKNGRF